MRLKDICPIPKPSFDPLISDEELEKISQDPRFQKRKDDKPLSQRLREGTVIINYDCETEEQYREYHEYIKRALAGEYDDE